MSEGDWDDDLVNDYGNQLIAKEHSALARKPDALWSMHQGSSETGLPPLDPMTGFMDALGNNPDASLEFLNGDTQIGDGKTVDNLDYLMKDRDWPEGEEFSGDSQHEKGIYTLGHALESATTGMPYDYDGTNMPSHTPAQAELTHELVATLGAPENTDLISDDSRLSPLKDSLGNITADYIGDFEQALTTKAEMPTNGAEANFGPGEVTNFLATVGEDPDAYKAITASQQAYNAAITKQVISDYDPNSVTTMAEQIGAAQDPGSQIAGTMSEARAEAVHHHKTAEAEEFNSTVKGINKWVGRGAEIAIGTAWPVVGLLRTGSTAMSAKQ